VPGLAAGVYRYRPATHDLEPLGSGDPRADLAHDMASHRIPAATAVTLFVVGQACSGTVKAASKYRIVRKAQHGFGGPCRGCACRDPR